MRFGRRSALLAVGVLMVAACVAWSSLASGTAQGKSTLSGSFTFAAPTSFQTGFSAVIGRFKGQYPNVEVRTQFVPIVSYNPVMTTQFKAGNGPDALYTSIGSAFPTTIRVLAAAGYLADVSDQTATKAIPKSLQSTVTYKGKQYGAPLAAWTGFYVYNKDKFKQLNLKVPTTLKELYALCGKISAAGYTPITVSPPAGDLANWAIMSAAPLVDGQDPKWMKKRNANKATFANSGWRDNIQQFVDAKNAKCFDSGIAGISRVGATAQFAQEKALMYPILQTQVADVKALNPKFNWSVFAPPAKKASQQTLFTQVSPLVSLGAGAKNNKAALAFYNFAARPAQAAVLAKYQEVMSLDQYQKKQGPSWMTPLKKVLYKNGDPALYQAGQYKTFSTFTTLNTDLVGLFTGQTTVNSILAKLDSTYGK